MVVSSLSLPRLMSQQRDDMLRAYIYDLQQMFRPQIEVAVFNHWLFTGSSPEHDPPHSADPTEHPKGVDPEPLDLKSSK